MVYQYGIKNTYKPSDLAPRAYGWPRGVAYAKADVPTQWVDPQSKITTDALRQQFAYEWFQSGERSAGFTGARGLVNPPFVSGAAGRLHPLLVSADGGPARILRGYIRRAEYDVTDELSKCRLYFMYNPEIITREYVSYLEQSALDPFNTVYQSGNLIAPPSILNFSFELFFDRQEECAGDQNHPGVFVDYQFFDMVVRNVIPQDPTQASNTLPDNGVMMVNPRDITVVFSPIITVQGRPTNAQVVFEKFTHRMTPVRMRIQLQILASYFGPVRDMVEYKKEELQTEDTIPIDEFHASLYNFTFLDVDADEADYLDITGGIGSGLIEYGGQLVQSNDANLQIRLAALDYAYQNVTQGGPGAGMDSGWTNYKTGGGSHRWDLPYSADCSGLVTECYVKTAPAHAASMGWDSHPATAQMITLAQQRPNVFMFMPIREFGEENLLPGDILIKNGHTAFWVRAGFIFDASSPSANPEVGERPWTFPGTFTHVIRPTPFGSTGSAAQGDRYNSTLPAGSGGTSAGGVNTTGWSPGTVVASGPQPGLTKLKNIVVAKFGVPDNNGYNPRCVQAHNMAVGTGPKCPYNDQISQHACGLAFDAMTTSSAKHAEIYKWALSAAGAQYGIHEVISGYSPLGGPGRWADGKWRTYSGRSPHTDHVHLSITVAAGAIP
jgi:hypothetical protein